MYKIINEDDTWVQIVSNDMVTCTESSNPDYIKWRDGWTEIVRALGTYTPEIPATFDEQGNELTPAVPGYWTEGAVVETIEHPPHTPDPYVPPPVDMVAEITKAMDALFDVTAQSKHYDNRITCTLRAGYPGPFQAEGTAFASWMDTQNAKAYQMLADVQAGTMPMPASVESALALLDPMVWP